MHEVVVTEVGFGKITSRGVTDVSRALFNFVTRQILKPGNFPQEPKPITEVAFFNRPDAKPTMTRTTARQAAVNDLFARQEARKAEVAPQPEAKAVAVTEAKPTLTIHDGKVVVSSVNLAVMFGKRHDHVLRDIDALIKETGAPNFGATSYRDKSNRMSPCYEIDRDGFTLLAMGFTGPKALQFKMAYIAEFNRMEATLRAAAPAPANLNDPATLRTLLLATAERELAQLAVIGELSPKAAALDHISASDGTMTITVAGKSSRARGMYL